MSDTHEPPLLFNIEMLAFFPGKEIKNIEQKWRYIVQMQTVQAIVSSTDCGFILIEIPLICKHFYFTQAEMSEIVKRSPQLSAPHVCSQSNLELLATHLQTTVLENMVSLLNLSKRCITPETYYECLLIYGTLSSKLLFPKSVCENQTTSTATSVGNYSTRRPTREQVFDFNSVKDLQDGYQCFIHLEFLCSGPRSREIDFQTRKEHMIEVQLVSVFGQNLVLRICHFHTFIKVSKSVAYKHIRKREKCRNFKLLSNEALERLNASVDPQNMVKYAQLATFLKGRRLEFVHQPDSGNNGGDVVDLTADN